MIDWLRRLRLGKPALSGAPPVRRQKVYSSTSGYVYQYYYLGKREIRQGDDRRTEFVFEVSADRKIPFQVCVAIDANALSAWEQDHERSISSTERYAIAKMALFQAFDERRNPGAMRDPVFVEAVNAAAILDSLGIG